MKIAIIGAGNLGGSIARGLSKGEMFKSSDIICTSNEQPMLDRLHEENPEWDVMMDNCAAVRKADIVLLSVKPWLIGPIIQEIKPALDYSRQILVSAAAGVTLDELRNFLLKNGEYKLPTFFRVIPNTAVSVRSSMTFICTKEATPEQTALVERLFNELGTAMVIDERLMSAATALASCGIAYALRYIRASIEGGVEMGFYPAQAQEIVIRTVRGATELLLANKSNPEQEIDKVTTPGGITIKGLNEMAMSGFTSSVIRGLKAGL